MVLWRNVEKKTNNKTTSVKNSQGASETLLSHVFEINVKLCLWRDSSPQVSPVSVYLVSRCMAAVRLPFPGCVYSEELHKMEMVSSSEAQGKSVYCPV